MPDDRKLIQELLDKLEQKHAVQEFQLSSGSIKTNPEKNSAPDKPTLTDSHSHFNQEDKSVEASQRAEKIFEEAEKQDGPWVNPDFPGVTVKSD